MLSHRGDWDVSSNAESGTGYSDILVETEDDLGIVIEIKYASDGNLEAGCREALEQIRDKDYAARLVEDGMERIVKYGIACWKKKCKVELMREAERSRMRERFCRHLRKKILHIPAHHDLQLGIPGILFNLLSIAHIFE